MGVKPWAWLVAALTLLGLYVTLAVRSGSSTAPQPLLAYMAIQAAAAAAVLARWRRTPGEARYKWLLMALTMLTLLASTAFNLAAALASGNAQLVLGLMASGCSGLFIVPSMYMIARTFSAGTPRMVRVLDGLIGVCIVVLMYVLLHDMVVLPEAQMQAHASEVTFLADAVNYSLAILATVRLLGSSTRMRRQVFLVASIFLWSYSVGVSAYNRLQHDGLPWWSGILLVAGFVAVMIAVPHSAPRWLRRLRPSRKVTSVIDGFAPIVLTVCVLGMGIGVSRLDFGPGIIASVLSVLFYGLRMACLQSRDRYRQRQAMLSNQRLQHQLGIDPLTGIANRIALDEHLNEVLHASRRGAGGVSVLMIDVDFFKQFNDSFGHVAGDDCLVHVVETLRANLMRSGDLLARYGGEEFAVVLPNTRTEAALMVAKRLVEAVTDQDLPHTTSPFGRVTISVGVVTCEHCMHAQAIDLLEAADRALYVAKHNGRNRCEMVPLIEDLPTPRKVS
jgi:diguanylate cyclase (GGDEF)-like protein